MNAKSRSFRRKIIYLVAIGALLGVLSWLGRPSTSDTERAKGSPGGLLAQLREKERLSQARLGEIDPTSETIKLATLGMRGVAANILWGKANAYKDRKDWTNLSATLEQITRLQPNFISVWQFQAWNLSYNVSVEFDDFRDRYRWVIRGINFLKKGREYNRLEPRLLWDIGWVISQKIGRSDERLQFRKMFVRDDEFHGGRPLELRDNWLVGKEWFRGAEAMVDSPEYPEVSMKAKSPLLFRSDGPMCQMNYAEGIETDGSTYGRPRFGDVARFAWRDAAREWDEYGSIDLPTSVGISIQLNDQERFEKIAKKLAAKIDDLEPGLREKILAEARAKLTEEQLEAIDTPMAERTVEQEELIAPVKHTVEISDIDVAKRITEPNRKKAIDLAKRAFVATQTAGLIERQRQVVNFVYWRRRAQVEQDEDTLSARSLIYEGNEAFVEADLPAARDFYDRGLAAWRRVLDKYPDLISDFTFGDDMMIVIERYRRILGQLDEPFPEKFILQDVIDEQKK